MICHNSLPVDRVARVERVVRVVRGARVTGVTRPGWPCCNGMSCHSSYPVHVSHLLSQPNSEVHNEVNKSLCKIITHINISEHALFHILPLALMAQIMEKALDLIRQLLEP